VSVTVTVNGKAGPSVVATNGDTISASVTKNAVVSVSASAAAAPGGVGATGPQGPPSTTITVGSVSTLAAGSSATVVGTSSNNGANLSLAFGIPAGATGATGATGAAGTTPTITATASTLSAGSSATVTATPSNGGANVALAFGIPRGADGAAGSGGGASLSDVTPSALGTASAGTSSTASRSDHVHAVPTISYANLTNVPSTFSPSTHTHSLASLTQSSATAGQVVAWNGTAWTAATPTSSEDLDGGDYVGVVASISVTQQPADVSISINQGSTGSASFTVAASSSTGAPVAYQWQRSQGSGWESINAATSTTLSLTGLTSSDDDTLYRCVVTAVGIASATSNAASLSVAVIVPSAPVITITSQPQSATIASTTSTASFSITASVSSGTLAYQWQKREASGSTWANVSSATSSTLSLTGLDYAADGGDYYRCRLTASGAAAVTSSVAVLNINWAAVPQITLVNVPSEVNWPAWGNSVFVTFDQRIYGAGNNNISFLWQARQRYSTGEFSSVESVLGANSVYGGTTGGSLTITRLPGNAVTVRCTITATNSYGTTTATTSPINVYQAVV
jgi:hypothetical protein